VTPGNPYAIRAAHTYPARAKCCCAHSRNEEMTGHPGTLAAPRRGPRAAEQQEGRPGDEHDDESMRSALRRPGYLVLTR